MKEGEDGEPKASIQKLDSSKYISVICDGDSIHTQVTRLFQHLVDPDGTVKETKFGMNVEMNKR